MRKRTYTHVNEYEAIILSMRQEGCTRREIVDELGLSVKQIEDWITRFNKREALLLAGKEHKVRGRPRKDGKPIQERAETELKRLRMENKLLRDFSAVCGSEAKGKVCSNLSSPGRVPDICYVQFL